MSVKQAEEFLKKVGTRKNVSKFEKHKEDIIYLYNEGATLEIITQYLETKGIKRTKGYNALSSYIKRNLANDILNLKKSNTSNQSSKHQKKEFQAVSQNSTVLKNKQIHTDNKTYVVDNKSRETRIDIKSLQEDS